MDCDYATRLLPLTYSSPYNGSTLAGEVVTGTNQANWAWICWKDGVISTGLGQVIARNTKLVFFDKDPLAITTFRISGWSGQNSNWTILYDQFTGKL